MVLLCGFELFTPGAALPVLCKVSPATVGNSGEEASGETAVSHIPSSTALSPSKAHSKGCCKMGFDESKPETSKNRYAGDFSQMCSSHLLLVVSWETEESGTHAILHSCQALIRLKDIGLTCTWVSSPQGRGPPTYLTIRSWSDFRVPQNHW